MKKFMPTEEAFIQHAKELHKAFEGTCDKVDDMVESSEMQDLFMNNEIHMLLGLALMRTALTEYAANLALTSHVRGETEDKCIESTLSGIEKEIRCKLRQLKKAPEGANEADSVIDEVLD
jgi:hypothetical protein